MEYPFYKHEREHLKLSGGRPLQELSLESVRDGKIAAEEIGIHPDTLRAQAEVAERNGFLQLASNLRRAAELAGVPDEHNLKVYEALRPGRASAAELEEIARELEETYEAPLTAKFIREAGKDSGGAQRSPHTGTSTGRGEQKT